VSRCKLSRSQKFVKVQDSNCVLMRVSGCNDHYEFVLGAGAKAKSVTNNLPLLSVLAFRWLYYQEIVSFFKLSPTVYLYSLLKPLPNLNIASNKS
jgi:hypothetical protein